MPCFDIGERQFYYAPWARIEDDGKWYKNVTRLVTEANEELDLSVVLSCSFSTGKLGELLEQLRKEIH